jgi:hypothetical protein
MIAQFALSIKAAHHELRRCALLPCFYSPTLEGTFFVLDKKLSVCDHQTLSLLASVPGSWDYCEPINYVLITCPHFLQKTGLAHKVGDCMTLFPCFFL